MTPTLDIKQAFSLAGQHALVTGGASGIGHSIAVSLSRMGADVGITVHDQPGAETLREISGSGQRGGEFRVDLQTLDVAGAEKLMEDFEGDLGPIDILVNNAGIIRRNKFDEHSASDWREVMATNLDAVWYLSQAAGRRMARQSYGRIISIASVLSFQGGIRVPGYATAKHGIVGLTKALANELAPSNVSVNAIAPGYITTKNTAALRGDALRNRQILERIPAGRWGEPQDIAGAAVFLASPAAAYVHGHTLLVDGGWMAR